MKDYESPQEYRDPAKFWTEIGGIYKDKVNEDADTYKRQLMILQKYLHIIGRNEDYPIKRVLEVGSGYGRITKLVLQELNGPLDCYHCIDISQPMIETLYKHLEPEIRYFGKDFKAIHGDISDSKVMGEFPAFGHYDLIISVECLMHIRPADIKLAIANIFTLLQDKGHLITLDFYSAHGVSYTLSPENFLHQYPLLYTDAGLSLVSLYKIFGQDQSVIHARKLLA